MSAAPRGLGSLGLAGRALLAWLAAALLVAAAIVLEPGRDRLDPRQGGQAGQIWLDAKPEALVAVRWAEPTVTWTARRRSDAAGEHVWIEGERLVEVGPPDRPDDPHADMTMTPEAMGGGLSPGRFAFVGGVAAEQLVERVVPLVVVRVLERVSSERLAEFGLAEPSASLTIELRDQSRVLDVGAPLSGGLRYLRDRQTGAVLVLEGRFLNGVERPEQRLLERRLTALEPRALVAARLQTDAGAVELEQRAREDPARAAWARAGGEPDDAITAWFMGLYALRGQAPADLAAQPTERRLTIALRDERGRQETIELHAGLGPAEGQWFATSSRLRGAVTLAAIPARATVDDAGAMIAP